MAHTNRLTALGIKSLSDGSHSDGRGLYLNVKGAGKNWSYVFQWERKRRELGLGSYPDISLALARDKASDARAKVRSGINPIVLKKQETGGPTFAAVSADFIRLKGESWTNAKHCQQWTNTLATYAKPIMDKAVDKITTSDVLACLEPIWMKKPVTASRVRQRIENVLDAAKAKGLRSGENPAAWKGHLTHLLGAQPKLVRGHQRALDYRHAPAFMESLRQREGIAAKALVFTVLNAVRTSETRLALWSEIDWDERVWSVPASRTKTKKLLRVALSEDALAILREVRALGSEWIFPNPSLAKPFSTNAMLAVLDRMGVKVDTTVHGFRSTFSDWAGETTDFPRDIVEMALGHAVGNAVERAYRRGDALERRRAVMNAWSAFCNNT